MSVSIPVFVTMSVDQAPTHFVFPGLGNCGKVNKDSDAIVAISKQRYDANGGANCDQVRRLDPPLFTQL
jgi:hypothetical protein